MFGSAVTRTGRWSALAVAVALASPSWTDAEGGPGNARLDAYADNVLLESLLRGAERKLAGARCRSLLDEYADAGGRPLRHALDEQGVTAPQFLRRLFFYEGSAAQCERSNVAYTTRGSRVIFVCSARLRAAPFSRAWAEAALIHEALHALGLGENPPSSIAIQLRVMDRCRS
jgi:hypothetical protein